MDRRRVGQAGRGCRAPQFLVEACGDPVCAEPGRREKDPLPVNAIEPSILQPGVGLRAPDGFRKSSHERASNLAIGGGIRAYCGLRRRTIIIAGEPQVCPRNEFLLERRGRSMEPDDGCIEVCPCVGIDRRYVAFPRVAYRLAELADVLAVVAKMDGELLPANRCWSLGIDAGQPIGKPGVKIEGRRRIPICRMAVSFSGTACCRRCSKNPSVI